MKHAGEKFIYSVSSKKARFAARKKLDLRLEILLNKGRQSIYELSEELD